MSYGTSEGIHDKVLNRVNTGESMVDIGNYCSEVLNVVFSSLLVMMIMISRERKRKHIRGEFILLAVGWKMILLMSSSARIFV